jgi:DNA-binding CsgD family transcriptional regulator
MNRAMNDRTPEEQETEEIVQAFGRGLIFVDANGQVLWMDEKTRRSIDGGLRDLELPISREERDATDCFISTVDVTIEGASRTLCVIQAIASQDAPERNLDQLIAATEEVMADPSWFTQPLIEKLKAWRQAAQPSVRASDLNLLTVREREILALVCEGRTDVEMGRILGLSQNTVRNHVASLFRKIGVNRRSAAVIWARERAITSHDVLAFRRPKGPSSGPE